MELSIFKKTSFLLGIYRIPHTLGMGIHKCVTVRKCREREKKENFADKCHATVDLPHFLHLCSCSLTIYIHLYNLWVYPSPGYVEEYPPGAIGQHLVDHYLSRCVEVSQQHRK
jgi:hypothetical protein